MTPHTLPVPLPVRDAELRRLLAAVVDTDRDESPFRWSELSSVCLQDTATRSPQ
ncbi:hypothetical protein ACFVW5_04925 [Streptomyces sp. NPDC058232]|uniref:hypothetical protein n=1 Tax=Streptomyces sp. NPDC058232 TaxID=3346393 RepID=UPI0036E2B3FF